MDVIVYLLTKPDFRNEDEKYNCNTLDKYTGETAVLAAFFTED